MGLNLGNGAVDNIMLGNQQVDRVYLGSNLIWEKTSPVPTFPEVFGTSTDKLGFN